jgi:hypothetical protein
MKKKINKYVSVESVVYPVSADKNGLVEEQALEIEFQNFKDEKVIDLLKTKGRVRLSPKTAAKLGKLLMEYGA